MRKNIRPWQWQVSCIDTPGDDTGGAAAATDTADAATQSDADKALFTQAGVNKVVADRLARERAKFAGFDDFKAKAARLDEIEAEQQTAEQKAARALEAARKATEQAQEQALRYRAAAAAGIDPEGDDFALIGGGDETTVMARARRLHELLAAERELADVKSRPPSSPPGHQRPAGRPGAAPADTPGANASVDAAALAAARRGRTKPSQ